jgi:hypothetical protein
MSYGIVLAGAFTIFRGLTEVFTTLSDRVSSRVIQINGVLKDKACRGDLQALFIDYEQC